MSAQQLLLVEDEDSIGALVSAYLEQSGYRVAWVRSGEDALARLDQLRPSLVILDIGLPGQDGFDVCRGIRARSTVPIVMLTARDEEPDRVAGLEVGAGAARRRGSRSSSSSATSRSTRSPARSRWPASGWS